MTREDIVEKVNALLAEEFEVDAEEFVPDANVRDTLSLYKVKIPVADLREIKTFDNLYDYIESHAKQE